MQDDEEPPVPRIPPPKPRSPQVRLAYVCLSVGALILMWWMLSHNAPRAAVPPTAARATQSTRMGDLLIGEQGHVDNGENIVFIAVDAAAFDALNTAASAGDTAGIHDLVAAGRVFFVSRNTGILVLENGVFSVRVRVTDGLQNGKSGWVPAEFVKR